MPLEVIAMLLDNRSVLIVVCFATQFQRSSVEHCLQ
jgi:hypothetical protein